MNIIIFGPPLAGKGTQSTKVVKDFGLTHLSTGDALRIQTERKTALGVEASKYMDHGQLVPDDLVAQVVESFYNEHKMDKGILFDGYPRNKDQAEHLLEIMGKDGVSIDQIVFLKVPKEELLKRAIIRAQEENRKDDKDKNTVLNRIDEFETFTIPAIQFLKNSNIKIFEVDGNQSKEAIYELIKNELN